MGQGFIWREEMNQYVMLSYGFAGAGFLLLTFSIFQQKRNLYRRLKDIDVA